MPTVRWMIAIFVMASVLGFGYLLWRLGSVAPARQPNLGAPLSSDELGYARRHRALERISEAANSVAGRPRRNRTCRGSRRNSGHGRCRASAAPSV